MTASLATFRNRVEGALHQPLPFDNEVLAYLLKVAPASQANELAEYVADFAPRWNTHDQAALVSLLFEFDAGASQDPPLGVAEAPRQGQQQQQRPQEQRPATERELAADAMLAQMLQDEEDAAFEQRAPAGGRGGPKKNSKKSFKPLNINYTVGTQATPAQLGTAAPSSLADMLRNRRQQQAGQRPPGAIDAWGQQPAGAQVPATRQSNWAPAGQDGGMTWAERAQVAQEQAAAAEAAATIAAAAADTGQQARGGGGGYAPAAGSLQLRLVVSTGGEYQVSANPNDSVGGIKARVEKMHQVPASRQRILFMGRELPDATEVRSIGLRSGQPLQLALRNAVGGAAGPAPAARQAPGPPTGGPPVSQRAAAAPQHLSSGAGGLSVRLRLPGAATQQIDGLPEDARVSELKRRIQQDVGIRADHVSLTFFGCPLPDTSKLADCGVASGAQLDVTLRPPTAAEASPEVDAGPSEVAKKKNKKKGKEGPDSFDGGHHDSATALAAARAPARGSAAPPGGVAQLPPRAAAASARASLVRAVFAACDLDGDGRLTEQELRSFARGTGFDGSAEEWAEEYETLCTEHGSSPAEGLDEESFARLVDDESDSGCYCTEEELRAMLEDLRKKAPQPAASSARPALAAARPSPAQAAQPSVAPAAPAVATPQERSARDAAIAELFRKCDVDRDGHLSVVEMRTFAELTGFEGGHTEWAEEFELLCAESRVDPARGISLELFNQFVNDQSDNGQYCTDEELRDMNGKLAASRPPPGLGGTPPVAPQQPPGQPPQPMQLPPPRPPLEQRSREMLIEDTFALCDQDRDSRLQAAEMRTFAGFVGFEGNDAEWADEYLALLGESRTNPAEGVGLAFFKELVNDQSDNGCFCTDDELRQLVLSLQSMPGR